MGRLARERAAKEARTKFGRVQPLKTFFSSYDDFVYDQKAPSGLEFQRLRRTQGWKHGDERGEVAWQDFRSSLVLQFNAEFGTKATDLLAWQTLCAIAVIKEASEIIDWEACEKASAQTRHTLFVHY
jgi:hypothetical protein